MELEILEVFSIMCNTMILMGAFGILGNAFLRFKLG